MPVSVGFEVIYFPGLPEYSVGSLLLTDSVGFEVRLVSQIDVSGGLRVGGSTIAFSGVAGGLRIGGYTADNTYGGLMVGGRAFSYTLVDSIGGLKVGGGAVNYISGGLKVGGRAFTPSTGTFDVFEYWMYRDLRDNDPYESYMYKDLV